MFRRKKEEKIDVNSLNEILARNTNQPLTKIAKDTDRDFYLSAKEAQEYGLIDSVLEKSLK